MCLNPVVGLAYNRREDPYSIGSIRKPLTQHHLATDCFTIGEDSNRTIIQLAKVIQDDYDDDYNYCY